MREGRAWLAGGALGAALVLAGLGGGALLSAQRADAARQASPARPVAVGLVNIERLLNELTQLRDMNNQIRPRFEQMRTEMQDLETRLREIQADLRDNIPQSNRQLRMEKQAELVTVQQQLQTRGRINETLEDLQNGQIIRELYVKAQRAVEQVAAREGIDIVLLDDRRIVIGEDAGLREVNTIILSKRVLFATDAVDITDRVLTVMNNEYAAGGGAGAPASNGQ